MGKVFVYADYQVSIPFNQIDWIAINAEIKKFLELRSKTWLSGVNTNTFGDFYEFDSVENAQKLYWWLIDSIYKAGKWKYYC